jgi:hypothetical protein
LSLERCHSHLPVGDHAKYDLTLQRRQLSCGVLISSTPFGVSAGRVTSFRGVSRIRIQAFRRMQFRNKMRAAFGANAQRLAKAQAPKPITLQKPSIAGAMKRGLTASTGVPTVAVTSSHSASKSGLSLRQPSVRQRPSP